MRTAWFDKIRPQEHFGRQRRPEGVRVREAHVGASAIGNLRDGKFIETLAIVTCNQVAIAVCVIPIHRRIPQVDIVWGGRFIPNECHFVIGKVGAFRITNLYTDRIAVRRKNLRGGLCCGGLVAIEANHVPRNGLYGNVGKSREGKGAQ